MPRGIPKAGRRVNRVYRPDLSEHFILVHPRRQLGIIKFNTDKTRAQVKYFEFDEDGDMRLGRTSWKNVTDEPKGKAIVRDSHTMYLHDFITPPANPYA